MSLVFHPELFDSKARAIEALEKQDIRWVADYTSCDCCHTEYGLELEGFREEQRAVRALQILRIVFPLWRWSNVYYDDHYNRQWVVQLCERPIGLE